MVATMTCLQALERSLTPLGSLGTFRVLEGDFGGAQGGFFWFFGVP